jgi:hypothetical protein
MRELKLNIFDITIACSCDEDVYTRLAKDFHYFIDPALKNAHLTFTFKKGCPDWSPLEGLVCTKQSFNSMTYKSGSILYNDYYGEALSILDLEQQYAEVTSNDLERLYEIAYLLILSRSGKLMDFLGFHKLHGFGVSYGDRAFLGMMPSKGGKSTLFLDLIKNNKTLEIISDDTPVIDSFGAVYSYPLRIGVEEKHDLSESLLEDSYTIDRSQWGKKTLIPLTSFPNKIAGKKSKVTLFSFKRIYAKECKIEKITFIETFINLQTHMVIGIGLPMILEYFLEFHLKDFFRLGAIFLRRLSASFMLSLNSENYKIYLGTDLELNQRTVENFIQKNQS